MTRDSINALDNNLFLSRVKVILIPNISSTVYVLEEILLKVNDKAKLKKITWETDDSQKLTDGYRSLCPSHALFISSFHFHVQVVHLDQGSA
jgi:hypothetical protein